MSEEKSELVESLEFRIESLTQMTQAQAVNIGMLSEQYRFMCEKHQELAAEHNSVKIRERNDAELGQNLGLARQRIAELEYELRLEERKFRDLRDEFDEFKEDHAHTVRPKKKPKLHKKRKPLK